MINRVYFYSATIYTQNTTKHIDGIIQIRSWMNYQLRAWKEVRKDVLNSVKNKTVEPDMIHIESFYRV